VALPTGEEITIEGEVITPDHQAIIEPDGSMIPNKVVLVNQED
jgi:hypothetical protein